MSIESERQSLSALADGELDPGELALLCARWRDDPAARECWHAYQLIGDVLRSDDLASTARRDAAFLAALRQRLAAEPVVLAPEPQRLPVQEETADVRPAPSRGVRLRRRWWLASSAIAAGFVLVVGALVAMRPPGASADPQLAQQAPPAAGNEVINVGTERERAQSRLAQGAAPATGGEVITFGATREQAEPPVLADAKLIRDARLDRYLAAHKQFSASTVLGLPSSFLRDASDASGR